MTATQSIPITNKLGLHARASAKLTQTASRFAAKITVSKEHKEVNAKSIMGVMMLAAPMGATISFTADGDDAEEAVKALVALVSNKFGEEE